MAEEKILRSWKEIADYLKCDRKTCARWEAQFGLPIHRIDPESPRSRVFAYAAELDLWMTHRRERSVSGGPTSDAPPARPGKRKIRPLGLAAGIIALAMPISWVLIKIVFTSPFPPVLAVTPFVSSDTDPDFAFLAEGLKIELIRRLNLAGDILVSNFTGYMDESKRVERGAPPLPRSDFMVKGSVALLPSKRFRLDLEVVDSENGERLWQSSWQTALSDYPASLAEAVSGIRKALDLGEIPRPSLAAGDVGGTHGFNLQASYLLGRIGTDDKDPMHLCLEGVRYANLGDLEANEAAIHCFQNALKKDPSSGPALIGLAGCYTNYLNFGWKTDPQWLEKAEEVLAKAEPSCLDNPDYYRQRIETLLLRDYFSGRDSFDSYLGLAEKGLDINPYHGGLNSILGACYLRRFDLYGREHDLDEALRLKTLANLADPGAINNIVFAQILMLKRRFADALDVCLQLRRTLDSDFVLLQAAEIQYYQGDLEACEPVFASLRSNAEDRAYALKFLGMIAAQKKDRSAALEALNEIELLAPVKSDIPAGELKRASIYAGIGDAASASEILARIFQPGGKNGGNYTLRKLIELDRNFETLRPHIKLYF